MVFKNVLAPASHSQNWPVEFDLLHFWFPLDAGHWREVNVDIDTGPAVVDKTGQVPACIPVLTVRASSELPK